MTAVAIHAEIPMTANRTFPTTARSSVDAVQLRGDFRHQGKGRRYSVFIHDTEGGSLIPHATVIGLHRVDQTRPVILDVEVGTILVCDGIEYRITDDVWGQNPTLARV